MPTETPAKAADGLPDRAEDPFPRPWLALALPVTIAQTTDLPTVVVAAHVSPVHITIGLGAVVLAGLGTLAAASLNGYSPTLLDQLLEEQGDAGHTERAAAIARREAEYHVVAKVCTAIGWILGLWSLLYAVDRPNLPWTLASFVLVMLLVAGSLPTAVARMRPERTLLRVLPFVHAGWLLLRWPVAVPLLATTNAILRVMRVRRPASDAAEVQKQVIAAVADSVTEDSLASEERTWIGNIVGLKDLQVSTVMTPRPDIIAFADATPMREAVEQALEQGFSRYPVYRDRIDEVVGTFYVKDALRFLRESPAALAETQVKALLRPAVFVPETMGAAQLLRRFLAGNQHMAIVLDEYGTTAGLVTVEDLIEEIVGDIADEYDEPTEDEPAAEQIRIVEAGRVLEIPARTTVTELNELLNSDLPEDGDWETVAGMVLAKCNHIPAVDETVMVDGVEFRVLAADERRILRLRVTVQTPQPAEDAR